MPRLKQIDPKTDSGEGADLLNGPLKDKQINIFKGLAINPGVLKAFLQFTQNVKGGALNDAEHEIVALVCGQMRNCDYCTAAHTQLAQAAGLSEDQTLAVRRGEVSDQKQQALIDFTRAVLDTDGFVTDEQLEAFRHAGYDDAAVIEVIAAATVNTFTNLYNHVHETEIDFPVAASV